MIDIHTHIIPALDDGPPDMETSIDMGRVAAEDGTETIISTSHSAETFAEGRDSIQARLDEVRKAWAGVGLDIKLEQGVEIFLTPKTVDELRSGQAWTLAGSRYVLVELPYQPWPLFADDALFQLQVAGYTPILAHPERYTSIQSDPNKMYELAERGILSQVTASALLGEFSSVIQRCAETLLRHNLAQFISSDAHGVSLRKRPPLLKSAVQAAAGLIGEEAAHTLVTTNPAHILNNTPLPFTPERVPPRRWSLASLFKGDS